MDTNLDGLIDSFLAEAWEENPVAATQLGIDGYDDRLGDLSAEGFAARHEREDRWHAAFSAVPDDILTLDERIDRDLILSSLRGGRVMRGWEAWRRNPATYIGPGLSGTFALFLHRLRPDEELAYAAASRLKQVPGVLDEGRKNIDPALAPRVFVERAIGQCAAAIGYVRDMLPAEVAEGPARALLADAGETAARAYQAFGVYLRELLDRASGDWAIGEERYSALLLEREMLGYGAREMHERGRAEFEAIAEDMRARAQALRGTEDWRAVVDELNKDHPGTPEEMREAYAAWTARARDFAYTRGLVSAPAGEECRVVPSPVFQRPVIAVASYQSPPAFRPSMIGHFFVPFPPAGISNAEVAERLESNSHNTIPTVSVHEAYPGHHWHLIVAQAAARPIRKVIGSSYFTEGWALYVESMMREEGLYDDPRHELCVSDARIFRAARIVVDTALHCGDMTFEEGVAFMRDRYTMAEPTARAEVGRYCTWPTQASSYLTGALEIERMRRRWFAEQRGSLRDFHDRLAGSGMLPFGLAERALFAS